MPPADPSPPTHTSTYHCQWLSWRSPRERWAGWHHLQWRYNWTEALLYHQLLPLIMLLIKLSLPAEKCSFRGNVYSVIRHISWYRLLSIMHCISYIVLPSVHLHWLCLGCQAVWGVYVESVTCTGRDIQLLIDVPGCDSNANNWHVMTINDAHVDGADDGDNDADDSHNHLHDCIDHYVVSMICM